MTRGLAAVALMGALWLTAGTAQALPRPELSRLVYSADLGCQYACAWLESNATCFSSFPTSNDLGRLVAGFVQTYGTCFPSDIELVGCTITQGPVFATNGFSCGKFPGMPARVLPLYISTAVQRKSDTNSYVKMTHTVYVCSFSICGYGVFVDGDVAITADKGKEITGAIYSSGVLRLGMAGGQILGLRNFVTSASNIYVITGANNININLPGDLTDHNMTTPTGTVLDSSNVFWKSLALSTWQGRVKSGVHGVPRFRLPVDDPRILIEPQTNANETINVANMRYYNRAAIRIVDDEVQKYSGTAGGTNNFVTIARLGQAGVSTWMYTGSFFYNIAISNYVRPLDIDVGKFVTWANSNAYASFCTNAQRAGLVYVYSSSNRPVRLSNAATLPASVVNGVTNGFVFVTGNALYTWGNVNWPANPNNAVPAACIADSMTVLSSDWVDSQHNDPGDGAGYVNSESHVWSAIITGFATNYDLTAGTTFFGGVECMPKYIEDWLGTGITPRKDIRGSLVSLWASKRDTLNYIYPYRGPFRTCWWYDPRFGSSPILSVFFEIRPMASNCVTNR